MPTYKETLEWSYKLYPTLHATELDVLNQLFFVIGNGTEWENGELCDKFYSSFEEQEIDVLRQREHDRKRYAELDKACEEFNSTLNELLKNDPAQQKLIKRFQHIIVDESNIEQAQKLEIEKRIEQARKLSDGIKSGFCWYLNDNNELIQTMYPVSEYSRIMNLPDDIKPDWLAAAKLAIQYALEGKWILTESDKTFILKAQQRVVELESKA
jgi:hypothetical protein